MDGKTKDQILFRLDGVQGHLAAVRRMVEKEAAHGELNIQLRVLRGSLRQIDRAVIRDGLHTYLAQAQKADPGRTADQIMQLLSLRPLEGGQGDPEAVEDSGGD